MAFRENIPLSSPKWVKPSDVLRLRKKLKPSILNHVPSSCVLKPVDQNVLLNRTKDVLFNPFRKASQKRKIELLENDIRFLDRPNENTTASKKREESQPTDCLDDNANFGYTSNIKVEEKEVETRCCSVLPVDWSLKTKVRFISDRPFPWKGCLKTSEEASGTTSFTRCLHSGKHQECTVDTSANARFHQQCLVWMHPTLPWLNLFPRFMTTHNSSSTFTHHPEIQDSLHNAWCDSFRSLYQLVRVRQCPYFYLCAATFTALFRAAGTAGLSDHHVMLTPTTRGFRQSLREEGINFILPLRPQQDGDETCDGEDISLTVSDVISVAENNTPEIGLCNEENPEDEPVTWLESLGLSQHDFPDLNPKRRKTDQEGVDHRPQSLICIEGAETQALVNFLLNSRSCIANTGPLAGIPPTLLAPCAFHGATLQPLKVRQARMNREQNCIEISGPVLPNTLDGLCNLFSGTQGGQFTATMKTLATTEAFGLLQRRDNACIPSVFATENLKDSGLCSTFLQQVCEAPMVGAKPFSEVTASTGMFMWK